MDNIQPAGCGKKVMKMFINVSKGKNNNIMLLVKDEKSFLNMEDAVITSTKMIEALNSILNIDPDTRFDYKVEIDLNAPYCAEMKEGDENEI